MAAQLSSDLWQLRVDVLVIGAGGAGLRAAIEAARNGADVLVASKMERNAPNCTVRAWGGFTYVTEGHAAELFRQVVQTGGFLNNQRLVETFVEQTPARVRELLDDFGMDLEVLDGADEVDRLGVIKLRGEGRNTGLGMTEPLRSEAAELGVQFLDQVMVTELSTAGGRVIGALAVDLPKAQMVSIGAKAVIVTTGGGGMHVSAYRQSAGHDRGRNRVGIPRRSRAGRHGVRQLYLPRETSAGIAGRRSRQGR